MAGLLAFLPPSASAGVVQCSLCDTAAGRKSAERLLTSLHAAVPSAGDSLIRKFVAASSKSAALGALSHLISLSSPVAMPVYDRVSEQSWFNWNPTFAAAIAALMEKLGRSADAASLISESSSKLKSTREQVLFYCELVEAFSQQGLKRSVLESYDRLREFPNSGRRPYESIIRGLCLMGLPEDAEEKLKEMALIGFKPSAFEYRLVLQCYGKLGSFLEMRRVLREMEAAGLPVDTVCANMVLSCYGGHGELSDMVSWIRRMKDMSIGFSIRTYNSVLNACPTVNSMLQDMGSLALSIQELIEKLRKDSSSPDEALLVQELITSSLLADILQWTSSEGKLDLHGLHVASAYVIMLQLLEEMKLRLSANCEIPLEISVICGLGKHSEKRGDSSIRKLVSEMMFHMNSPMKIDRKDTGRFRAKGKAVKEWLC